MSRAGLTRPGLSGNVCRVRETPNWTGFKMYEEGNMMTAAELRLEAELDMQSAEERWMDSMYDGGYDEPDPEDPETCEHGDGYYPEGAGYHCDRCETLFLGPRQIRPDAWTGWPVFWVNGWE